MSEQGTFQLSQGLDVLIPRSGQAYPIPCDEWALLRTKISKLTTEPVLFHTAGSLLIGASVSTLVTILLGTFQLPAQQRQLDIAWAIVVVTLLTGCACAYFAHKERVIPPFLALVRSRVD